MTEEQKWSVASPASMGRTCTEHPCKKRFSKNCRDLSGIAVCCALSLLSFGICIFVYLKTAELQSKIFSLEKERDTQLSAWLSMDQVEPIIIGRLDQILEEKLAARLPKVREAREAPRALPVSASRDTGSCFPGRRNGEL
ncbi:hypothetical protein GJAV_G00242880, partial [Gymnothorax javanicus]